jgi:hypothetical protein
MLVPAYNAELFCKLYIIHDTYILRAPISSEVPLLQTRFALLHTAPNIPPHCVSGSQVLNISDFSTLSTPSDPQVYLNSTRGW